MKSNYLFLKENMMSTCLNRLYFIIILTFLLSNGFAQELSFVTLKDKGSSQNVRLDKLSISVFVVENIATTTIEMDFFNNTNRVLEGELNFPLGDGVTVSRFALDVNGEMREGVVVEKEKATQAFEAVTRRKVDPGILEMTKGNNFKARVYPIPAKGFKKAIIAYEQELKSVNGEYIYNLPLNFKHELSNFSVHVEVVNKEAKVSDSDNELINLKFQKERYSYISNYKAKNIKLDTHLGFVIPIPDKVNNVITCKGKVENEDYFYINTQPKQQYREKAKPEKITIIWDASASAIRKNIEKELTLLKNYFSWIKNVEVDLITFSNTTDVTKKFNIKNRDWTDLENLLKNTQYDGGTQLGNLDFTKIKSDEILFFTDAISNFGNSNIQLSTTPVSCINSNSIANLNYLKYIAEITKGNFVNLNDLNIDNALKLLTHQKTQFIKAEYSNQELYDVLPDYPNQFDHSFSVTGKINTDMATIKLYFGYADKITETKTYVINNKKPITNGLTEKIWVQKKIAGLSIFEDKNEDEIKALGKKFSIVTKNTSLIVLDEVTDYVQYEIIPPNSLKDEYYKLLNQKKTQKKQDEDMRLTTVCEMFKSNIDWWEKVINFNELKKEPERERIRIDSSTIIPNRTYSEDTKLVTGIVKGSDGIAIPGTTVIVRNTNHGTVTDHDGKFSLLAPMNGILKISFVGYQTVEIDITNLTNIEVELHEENMSLDEVVVSAYSVTGSTTGAAQAVNIVEDDLEIDYEVDEFGSDKQRKKASIQINSWDSKAPYMKKLKESNPSQLYKTYLSIKSDYSSTPSFFFDVANYFFQQDQKEMALRIISNLAEIELENHEILRSLGRKLSEFGYHKEAIYIFKEVLKIRSFEPQSYRDLGLAYADNGEYQKAIEHLYKVIENVWGNDVDSRFRGIEVIVLHEINSIIQLAKDSVDTSFIDERFLFNMPVDIRIVIDWDANDTDIDLWITDPRQEKCSYQNKDTRIGGRISNDITSGYGPEEFLLKHAIDGKYKIEANYYGSTKQSITGPVTVRAFLFTNFGREDEVREVVTIQITKEGEDIYFIGNMKFETKKNKEQLSTL